MVDLDTLLKARYAGDIFSNSKLKIKKEYKELSKRWHPDMNGNSEESHKAMSIINIFYKRAIELVEKHEWEKSNYLSLTTIDNRIFEATYYKTYNFELGKFYICNKAIIYTIDKKYKSFYDNFKEIVKNIKYPNVKLQEELERFIPKINLEFETSDYYVMRISKDENTFSLIDIHHFYNGTIPERHVAWMMSRLYNLVCLLDYNKISHNALTIESLFVNPEHHGIFIYGGWWFSTKIDAKLKSVPRKVFNGMPYEAKSTGITHRKIDLEIIRMIARQLLGDEYGSKILANKDIPQPMKHWVLEKCGKTAFGEYQEWNQMLDKAFGKRKFIVMDVNKNKLYKE